MEDIPSYPTDSEEDFSNRFVKHLNSLPYLVTEKRLDVEKLLQSYKKNFNDFIIEYNLPINHIETYLKLWLYYNKESNEEKFLEYPKLKEIIKSFKLSFDPLKFKQKEKNEFMNELKVLKKKFAIKVEKNDLIHINIKNTKEQKHTEFKKQRYRIYFMTCINNLSLAYIFSMLECNDNIPFASYQSICKLSRNFTTPWSESFTDKIFLKIKIGDTFIDSFLLLDEKLSMKIEISIDTSILIDFKEYIKSIFKIPIQFGENFDEHDIYGVYIFPNQKFNKYILSDMIMNNPIMSKFLVVDESIRASTKKTGLLTKFRGNDIKDSSCNIICKKVLKNDIDLKGLDKKNFPIGSYYTKVRISKFNDMKNINLFITLLSKFLTIYHIDEKSVYDIYQSFLGSSFTLTEDEIEQEEDVTIENIVPELFVSGYRRICAEDRHPTIIDEDETIDLEEYKDYIKFPKDDKYCYQCKNKKYPYIGLLTNTLSNMNQFEYIPCCYKTLKHNIDAYYFNKDHTVAKKQQNIIKTLDRLLDEGHYGEIPKNLDTFLTTLYHDKDYLFYRKGISKTKHSFLDCILHSLNVDEISIQHFYIASQENPDLTLDEMKHLFEDKNIYMDPRRWIQLLEHVYQCNIHVFSRNDKNKDSELVIPFHISPYLKYESVYDKTIIILENENSRTKEIRCELIVMELKDKYTTSFSNDLIKTQIKQFYLTLNDKKPLIKYSQYPQKLSLPFSYQVLDTSKKTRCIVTTNNVFLLCDPIPPLNLPIKVINNFESEFNDVQKLFNNIDENKDEIKIGMFTILLKRERPYKNDLLIYKKNKKIATILGEFFIYLYSTYLHKNDLKISIYSIKSFIDSYVIIKETKYEIIPSSIIDHETMINYGYLNKKDKLIISNNETLKRLICLLRLRITNSIHDVTSYHKKIEFLNFYKNINDYNSFSNIIIYSTDLYKIENVTQIVYNQFQYLPVYYLQFNKKIFIVKSIDKISYDIDYYIKFYDKNLILVETKGDKKDNEINLIQYEENYIDEDNKKKKIKRYQNMIALF